MAESARATVAITIIIAGIAAISALTVDMLIPVQPEIAASFGLPTTAGAAMVTTYFWGYAAGHAFWGPQGDRLGRLAPLQISLVGFIIASLACAWAPNFAVLTVARFVQGFCGGAAPVTARAIARDQGGGVATSRMLATISFVIGFAPLLGPSLGAFLTAQFGWRANFLLLVGLGAAALAAAPLALGRVRAPDRGAYTEANLLSVARSLLRQPEFIGGASVFALMTGGYFTLLALGAAAALERYGVTSQVFGPLFAIIAVAYLLGAFLAGQAVGRLKRDTVLSGAIALAAVDGVMIALSLTWALPLWAFIAMVSTYVLAFGLVTPTAAAKALEPAAHSAGAAASVLGLVAVASGAAGAQIASSGLYGDSAYAALAAQMLIAPCGCLLVMWVLRRFGRRAGAAVVRGGGE